MPPDQLAVGMSWRWRGEAQRLDSGVAALWLDRPADREDRRQRARRRMRRLSLAELPEAEGDGAQDAAPGADSLVLTDGERLYPARIVQRGGRRLAVFDPLLPAPGAELWIAGVNLAPARQRRGGVICFLPGTMIATPCGRRAVETLEQGDLVETRDNGPQPVVWRGETRLSGAELYLYPHLRPLRIAAGALGDGRPQEDLLVSPAHRLLLPAPASMGGGEVLVAAAHLEDGRGVRRDFALGAVRYVHLMLERHEILTANGLPCESFHPGMADTSVLKWHARTLERAAPGLAADPARYGAAARRCLNRGEAAILRYARA
ncbi:MAG: Hint domain-containing protein [Rhodobacteraceae bacterium]|nr:Hint domain-containing protein [Paracoccaceae bacterium]